MKLGERLLRDGRIDEAQLKAALHEQVLVGGRLGGHLVAAGYLGEDALWRALAEATGVPAATPASSPEARVRLDEETARRECALPLALAGAELVCALADPKDERGLAVLRRASGLAISPRAAGETWILDQLDAHYAPAQVHAASEPGAIHGSRPANRMTRPIRMGQIAPPHLRPHPIAAVDGQKLLDQATGRDQIGDALVAFSRSRLDSSILFAVRHRRAVGWRGQGPGIDGEALSLLSLRAIDGELIERPLTDRRTFRGRVRLPPAISMLGAVQGPKGEVVVVPCLVDQRVVSLLVGTTRGPADDAMVRALENHAAAAAVAYQRLIEILSSPPPSA